MRRSHVALTKCFVCNESSDILLATKYYHTKDGEEPVKDLSDYDGKVITKEPCQKCKDLMKQGIILISAKDGESGDNPFRTGG
ncbi:MAG: hypothetical protein H8E34_10940 [Bacteroidetes bacterium]|nr:hypothetical protein [Bacteroidota bacterium]